MMKASLSVIQRSAVSANRSSAVWLAAFALGAKGSFVQLRLRSFDIARLLCWLWICGTRGAEEARSGGFGHEQLVEALPRVGAGQHRTCAALEQPRGRP